MRQARVSALWRSDGRLYAITCAHAFAGRLDEVHSPAGGPIGRKIAGLLPNRDVAIVRLYARCALDEAWLNLPHDRVGPGAGCVWVRDAAQTVTTVTDHAASNTFLAAGGPFIETLRSGEVVTDSGAPLMSPDGAQLYGLLSGITPTRAYYTPFAGLLALVRHLL